MRRLGAAETVDDNPILPEPGNQGGEIAVRSHDPEPVHLALVEQVDRVDRHRHISRVLALGYVELLLRANAEFVGDDVPFYQRLFGEISIGAPDVDLTQFRHDGQHGIDTPRINIIRVDQQGDVLQCFI